MKMILGVSRVENIVQMLNNDDRSITKQVEIAFLDSFNLAHKDQSEVSEGEDEIKMEVVRDNVQKRLNSIDIFLDELAQKAIKPRTDHNIDKMTVVSKNVIEGASLTQLLAYAFPSRKKDWPKFEDEEPNRELKKLITFEARRKLSLFIEMDETDDKYDRVVGAGREPIDRLFKRVISVYKDNNSEDDWNIEEEDGILYQNGKIQVEDREHKLLMIEPVKPKERSALYRKKIVRGLDHTPVGDIFRRSIIMERENSSKDVARLPVIDVLGEYFKSGLLNFSSKVKKSQMSEIKETQEVIDLIKSILDNGNGKVKIYNYKPTPVAGSPLLSEGVGGGAEVRFAKLYVTHTDDNGVVRDEEIQIFSPSDDGTSGQEWYNRKKKDDEEYFFRRLMDTKGLRSFIELLYPSTIYGDPIRGMYSKENGNGST